MDVFNWSCFVCHVASARLKPDFRLLNGNSRTYPNSHSLRRSFRAVCGATPYCREYSSTVTSRIALANFKNTAIRIRESANP